MIAVLQRVRQASVDVDGARIAEIGPGLLVLLGVAKGDVEADLAYIADKIVTLRIFSDEAGKMNRSIQESGGAVLLVSQFTLLGDTRQGRRPGFDAAAPPDAARNLYESVAKRLTAAGLPVQTGRFGALMQVSLQNDGPVTFILDSRAEKRNKDHT